jgi:HSP20 family protein
MQQDINRIFSSAGTTTSTREGEGGTLTAWVPPIEIDFRDNNLVISAELPGLNENDVEVDITDDMLIIQGERQVERREDERGFRRTERQYGRFYRAIALPDGADANNARAEFSNGVLRVTIPVAQEQSQKMRQLPIQAAGSSQPSSKGQSAGQQSGSTSASEKEKAA